MGKSSKNTHGAVGSTNLLMFEPETLVIVTDPKHPLYDERVKLDVDESLVLNIMHHGVLEPVLVRRNADSGETEVVDGRQRVRAIVEANRRLKERGLPTLHVPAVVRKGSDDAHFGAMISTNEIRQQDTPLVRARKMQRAMERGLSEAQVATLFGVGAPTIKSMVGVLEASAPIRNALEVGTITATDAYRLAKLPHEEQTSELDELLKRAPKLPGRRRKRGTLKRAATSDASPPTPSGAPLPRSRAQVQTLLDRVRETESIRENDRAVAVATLEWVLGNDASIDFCAFEGDADVGVPAESGVAAQETAAE